MDEESDPKKYIEKLTGKLGQSIRSFTEKNNQPDIDLEKYVINSILSATNTDKMDDADVNDIVNKIKSGGGDNNNNSGNMENNNDNNSNYDDENQQDEGFTLEELLSNDSEKIISDEDNSCGC